ncbi:hypothetical protein BDN70DRAFT_582227 [Pholiota conissans]|uniref:Protein kinase domain-containing protein n=1 Tax=Pholiota conissans TaxID=109636 RepID=A0A9P5Z6G4_9AGAR|nr:hypothetical protein BDN70DRAFT_582227 [Pholiota conissans]
MSNRIVIPSLADLPGVLRAPLKDKIPIDASTYALLSCTDGRWKDRRSADAVERLFKIGKIERLDLYCLVSAILYPPPDHDAKGTWYYFWDTNIRFPLEALLGPDGRSNRYSEEPTQMRDVSPNYAFILSDTCVFRGEESASGDPENLMLRMAAKVNWIYNSAPYMLGYCCNGPNMTFVAIAPPTGSRGGRPTIYILATFDLRLRENRIDSLLHLVNLSTILPLLSKVVNPPVNDWRNFNPKLENKITNKFTSTLTAVEVEHLRQVHAILKEYRVPNTDALISSESHSKPQRRRGVVRPQSEAELRECLQCVLASLKVAHSIQLYHCNVRWDNILCEGPQKWILANWENATAKILPANTAASLPSSGHGYFPALSYVREAEMDIWSIGYLIQTCGIQDQSEELSILGEHIRRRAQNLTADEVDFQLH